MKVEMQLALARTRRGLESGIFYGPPIRSQFYESWCLASGIPAHDAVWVGPTPPVLICDLRPDATVMNLTEFTDTLARQVGERFDIDPMLLLQEPPPLIAKAVQCGKTASTLAMLKYLARDPRDERLARLKQRGPAPRGKWWLNRR